MQRIICKTLGGNRGRFIAVAFVLTMAFSACNDVFEEDISTFEISLLSPQDSLNTDLLTHLFLWEEVEGAIEYRFQVARPNFTNPEEFIVDSTVFDTEIYYTLFPGEFTWRVRAENGSSETDFESRWITINETESLNGQTPILDSPADDGFLNTSNIELSWDELATATNYRLIVSENNNGTEGTELWDVNTEENEYTLNFTEGEYVWKIAASNDVPSTSNYSELRMFTVDLTNPTDPTLSSPSDNSATTGTSIDFNWTYGSDLNPYQDVLYIASDNSFNTIVHEYETIDDSYEFDASNLNSGTYYWKIRTYDLAQNFSESSTFSFTYSE